MVIFKPVRTNKQTLVSMAEKPARPSTFRQQVIIFADTFGGRDFTITELLEAIPKTQRRNLEKICVDLVRVGFLETYKCRCDCTNLFNKVRT